MTPSLSYSDIPGKLGRGRKFVALSSLKQGLLFRDKPKCVRVQFQIYLYTIDSPLFKIACPPAEFVSNILSFINCVSIHLHSKMTLVPWVGKRRTTDTSDLLKDQQNLRQRR